MTPRQQISRAVILGACAMVVGALDSLVKGNGGGFFGTVAQAGAPWLLLAFLCGALTGERRLFIGALTGLAATMLALVGFYFVNSFVVDFGPHAWTVDLRLAAISGREYFALALVSGTAFGVFGAWWKRRLSMVPVVVVGVLFVIEGVVRAMHADVFVQYGNLVAALEASVGVLWIIVALWKTRSLRQRSRASHS